MSDMNISECPGTTPTTSECSGITYGSFLKNIILIMFSIFSLKKLHNIENKLQRTRGVKNQPRTCDIDLIDYKGKIFNSKELITPHPKAHLRNFVLFPIKEISPTWIHPILNKKIDFLIKKLSFKLRNEITRIKERVIIDQ